MPDMAVLKEHLRLEGRLPTETLLDICNKMMAALRAEPSLLRLTDPLTVVGDIHGQYYDFLKLIEVGKDPAEQQYLFLGDYVDRGCYSCEVLICLFCYKLKYPKNLYFLRGNHECRQLTEFFNFREEAVHKYGVTAYEAFSDVFDCLPLGAIINGLFLCLHAGLSPDMTKMEDLLQVDRFMEPPRTGLMCDVIWSDPAEEKEGEPVPEGWINNEVRGCSYFFGFDRAKEFLDDNQILTVLRAHEAQMEGFKMHRINEDTGFPSVITLFSAPNYCDVYNNKAAVMKFENNTLNVLQFDFTEHPYALPNFQDLFSWSMPFISEKITEILHRLMQPGDHEDDENEIDHELPPIVNRVMRSSISETGKDAVELAIRIQKSFDQANQKTGNTDYKPVIEKKSPQKKAENERLRAKLIALGKMQALWKSKREKNESAVQLGVSADKIDGQELLNKRESLKTKEEQFAAAKEVDGKNEDRRNSLLEQKGEDKVENKDSGEKA
jgi:serine/threonine-protein phosphatase 2B catalytic subunit